MPKGALSVMPLRSYQVTILARLPVLPFYHSYQFSALPVLTFYHFGAPAGFAIYQFYLLRALANFSISCHSRQLSDLPVIIFLPFFGPPTGFTILLFFYQFCHFSALVGFAIFVMRINFRPCRFSHFLYHFRGAPSSQSREPSR